MDDDLHRHFPRSLDFSACSLSSPHNVPLSSSLLYEEDEEQQQLSALNLRDLPFSSLGCNIWSYIIMISLVLCYFGSSDIYLGTDCSHLVQVNSFFVQSIKSQEIEKLTQGTRLYGFFEIPPLDVEISWSETHDAFVHSGYHEKWEYFLNMGSTLNVSYSVKSPTSAPISLLISQGKDDPFQWVEDPSYPNTTLSWNIIHGDGTIQQDIRRRSKSYYIALGSLDANEVEVQIKFTIQALVYNTAKAYYNCSLSLGKCSLPVFLSRTSAALVTSPAREQGVANNKWHVKLSYGPRWITFFLGSGFVSIFMVLAFKILSIFQVDRRVVIRTAETRSEQASLLSRKDDDLLSLGSSYDSISTDEEELDKWLGEGSLMESN